MIIRVTLFVLNNLFREKRPIQTIKSMFKSQEGGGMLLLFANFTNFVITSIFAITSIII